MTYRYASNDHMAVVAPDGRFIPVDPDNRDYAALVASGEDIAPYEAPPAGADAVNQERDRRIAVFPFGGRLYQLDGESQVNVAGAGTLALAAIIEGAQVGNLRWSDADEDFVWLAADNTATAMDAQTMFAFAQAAAAWKREHIYAARVIKSLTPIPADYADNSRWPTA